MAKRFNKLTRQNIRRLPAGSKITEHGVYFERLADGDGVYSINIMVDRRRIHRVIGRESEGVTRKQAEDIIAQLRTDARHDRLNLPSGRKTTRSFPEAARDYIDRLRAENGKNINSKERQLIQHIIPFFRNQSLAAVTTDDVERYKQRRLGEGAAPATINRELAVLSHMANKALEWKWFAAKPYVVRRYKESNGRINFLTIEQCRKLEEAAAHDANENIHTFVVVGLRTGMRHQEILRMRWADIEFDKLSVWIEEAKAGSREQPLTRDVVEYLKARKAMLPSGCEWVFPSPASISGHAHTMRKAFRRVVKSAGFDPDKITPHIMRHTAVTHLVQAGVDLPTVQRISGHKTLSMVARYAHQHGAHIQKAMQKLSSKLNVL